MKEERQHGLAVKWIIFTRTTDVAVKNDFPKILTPPVIICHEYKALESTEGIIIFRIIFPVN